MQLQEPCTSDAWGRPWKNGIRPNQRRVVTHDVLRVHRWAGSLEGEVQLIYDVVSCYILSARAGSLHIVYVSFAGELYLLNSLPVYHKLSSKPTSCPVVFVTIRTRVTINVVCRAFLKMHVG